jgi:hypothetical protein
MIFVRSVTLSPGRVDPPLGTCHGHAETTQRLGGIPVALALQPAEEMEDTRALPAA